MTVIDSVASAPHTDPSRPRPGVRRQLQGDGANVILMNFAPGQCLDDHKAAHPILVQCTQGRLLFTCGDDVVEMGPGIVLHLTSHLTHRVDCPADAPGKTYLDPDHADGGTPPVTTAVCPGFSKGEMSVAPVD